MSLLRKAHVALSILRVEGHNSAVIPPYPTPKPPQCPVGPNADPARCSGHGPSLQKGLIDQRVWGHSAAAKVLSSARWGQIQLAAQHSARRAHQVRRAVDHARYPVIFPPEKKAIKTSQQEIELPGWCLATQIQSARLAPTEVRRWRLSETGNKGLIWRGRGRGGRCGEGSVGSEQGIKPWPLEETGDGHHPLSDLFLFPPPAPIYVRHDGHSVMWMTSLLWYFFISHNLRNCNTILYTTILSSNSYKTFFVCFVVLTEKIKHRVVLSINQTVAWKQGTMWSLKDGFEMCQNLWHCSRLWRSVRAKSKQKTKKRAGARAARGPVSGIPCRPHLTWQLCRPRCEGQPPRAQVRCGW